MTQNDAKTLEQISEALTVLRLPLVHQTLEQALAQPQAQLSRVDWLWSILEPQVRHRIESRVERRIKAARLPERKTLEAFDFAFQPNLDRDLVLDLASLKFADQGMNVLLAGKSGTGKSHIALALGLNACAANRRVRYTTSADMLTTLIASLADDTLIKSLKQYTLPELLIIDEVGLEQVEKSAARRAGLMQKVLIPRYTGPNPRSTIITSNIEWAAWGDYLDDHLGASAILDRLIHHSHIEARGLPQQTKCHARDRRPELSRPCAQARGRTEARQAPARQSERPRQTLTLPGSRAGHAPPPGVESGMRAADHTRRMLRWWAEAGIDRADLAVRRSNGMMLWHHALPLDRLPLAWARAENARRGDVYIRPARGRDWPLVFLDDLPPRVALATARKYAALGIETSARGGCHVWLACVRPLDERTRRDAQRWLAQRTGADPASTSGEHLGRLAGYKNWKRGGVWVNVLVASHGHGWEPSPALESITPAATEQPRPSARAGIPAGDSSESAWEWGWVRRLLATGHDPQTIYERLLARARPRRGRDAERYARRTVEQAVLWG